MTKKCPKCGDTYGIETTFLQPMYQHYDWDGKAIEGGDDGNPKERKTGRCTNCGLRVKLDGFVKY